MARQKKRIIALLILVILALHLAVLFILFKQRIQEHFEQPATVLFQPPPPVIPQAPLQVAALKPKASNFGMPSMVPQPPPAPPSPDKDDQQAPDSQQEDVQEQPQESEAVQTAALPLPEQQETLFAQKKEQKKKKEEPQKKPAQRRKRQPRMTAAEHDPDHKVQLANLSKGFLLQLKNEGEDWLKRDGNDKLRPHKEELKYLSYIKKITWFLQNEFNSTSDMVQMPSKSFGSDISILMIIDKHGNLTLTRVMRSTKIAALDNYILRHLQKAGPFPPLPEHFKKNEFKFNWSARIHPLDKGPQRLSLSVN